MDQNHQGHSYLLGRGRAQSRMLGTHLTPLRLRAGWLTPSRLRAGSATGPQKPGELLATRQN